VVPKAAYRMAMATETAEMREARERETDPESSAIFSTLDQSLFLIQVSTWLSNSVTTYYSRMVFRVCRHAKQERPIHKLEFEDANYMPSAEL
jgi:hypothetical protein